MAVSITRHAFLTTSIPHGNANMTAQHSHKDRAFRIVGNTVDSSTQQQLITRPVSKHAHTDGQQSSQQTRAVIKSSPSNHPHRASRNPSLPSTTVQRPPTEQLHPELRTMPAKDPKKKVRFDPVPRDESDEVYQSKTSPRFAEAKKRHAPKPKAKNLLSPFSRPKVSSAKKPREDPFEAGFAIGVGLSSLAALGEVKKSEAARAEKRAAFAATRAGESGRAAGMRISGVREGERRSSVRRCCDDVYVEKRPRVVCGDKAVLGDCDWAMVRRRTVVGYRK